MPLAAGLFRLSESGKWLKTQGCQVLDAGSVSERAEPDVFANAFGASKLVEVSTGPDDPSQTGDPSLLYYCVLKANV